VFSNELFCSNYLIAVYLSRTPFHGRYNWKTNEGQDVPYYTYGAGVTQVELDCLTGRVTVSIYVLHLRYTSFNPLWCLILVSQYILYHIYARYLHMFYMFRYKCIRIITDFK